VGLAVGPVAARLTLGLQGLLSASAAKRHHLVKQGSVPQYP